MKRLFFFIIVLLFDLSVFADNKLVFIEFNPLMAVKNGYNIGVSELQINSRTVHSLSFKKGRNVYFLAPRNISSGYYPPLYPKGMAFDAKNVVLGCKDSKTGRDWLLLVNTNKDSVKLTDIMVNDIDNSSFNKYEFILPDIDTPKYISMYDNVSSGFEIDLYESYVKLFVSIKSNKMNVDYLSEIYKERFNNLKNIADKDEYQFMEYLIYGILSGSHTIDEADKIFMNRKAYKDVRLKDLLLNAQLLKYLILKFDITSSMEDYFSGNISREDLYMNIKNASSDEMELFQAALTHLEFQLKDVDADEVFFTEFISYAGGYIKLEELEKAVSSTISNDRNIKNIIENIYQLNDSVHKSGYIFVHILSDI